MQRQKPFEAPRAISQHPEKVRLSPKIARRMAIVIRERSELPHAIGAQSIPSVVYVRQQCIPDFSISHRSH